MPEQKNTVIFPIMPDTSNEKIYIAIDLKSFYASAECVDLKYDPLDANLVVADASRTEKTICLAVTPALKAYGIPGRARLFEVIQKVNEINAIRLQRAPHHRFTGDSYLASELNANPSLRMVFAIAKPRMQHYIDVSTRIYSIYLKYIAPEHIHVYSIDEVFIDATPYLRLYKLPPRELAMRLIRDVFQQTGITATAGIGTNLYLCKIAMDIVAKHIPADADGVRIAELDEHSYREQLWAHRPITDFWRVGHGIARRLSSMGMYTMGDVARMSVQNDEVLYRTFGINAELLIDHAWGYEPVTIADIKSYRPESNSISSGQVLHEPYNYDKTKVVIYEMIDQLALDLVEKNIVTNQLTLTIGYDVCNLKEPAIRDAYKGEIHIDHYGRAVPCETHGTINLSQYTSSGRMLADAISQLILDVVNPQLYVRRITIAANHVISENRLANATAATSAIPRQLDLFTDYAAEAKKRRAEEEKLAREKRLQQAVINIKKNLGKNAVLKGVNLDEGATGRQRNQQIGGHQV
jgi:DNA polymerase V